MVGHSKKTISAILLSLLMSAGISHAATLYEGPNGEVYIGDYLPRELAEKGYAPKGEKKSVKEEPKADGAALGKTEGSEQPQRLENERIGKYLDKIRAAYSGRDYQTAARLIKEYLPEMERAAAGMQVKDSLLYQNHLLLAHIYTWKLDRPESALAEYRKMTALRTSSKELQDFPPVELLYAGEIRQNRKEYPEALENYKKFLDGLNKPMKEDQLSSLLRAELRDLVKYQMDGMALESGAGKDSKPMLERFKFNNPVTDQLVPIMAVIFTPIAEYELAGVNETNLPSLIKQSTPGISGMIFNYSILLNFSAGSVNESSEKAFNAYLERYPEGFCAQSLRYKLYRFYKNNEQGDKAKAVLAELEKINKKRGMKLLSESGKRFSSPEETWKTFKKALLEGDMDSADECFVAPARGRSDGSFEALDPENRKKIVNNEFYDLEKLKAEGDKAEYRIFRLVNGKKTPGEKVEFMKIDGEWKIVQSR